MALSSNRSCFSPRHVQQVTARKTLHIRECGGEIMGKSVNDLCPPALEILTFQNVTPDLPVQQNQFTVD